MGKASSNKKVARAARVGGRRTTHRSGGSWGWPVAIAAVVVVGTVLVAMSRNEANKEGPHPRLFSVHPEDHWHAAFGLDVCGAFQATLPQAVNSGIHTHGDGLIHVEASNSTETGNNANLGKFVSDYGSGFSLKSTELRLPGGKRYKNGDKCGDKPGVVQVKRWTSRSDKRGAIVATDPRKLLLKNGEIITIAFVPRGTNIPQPPSVPNLSNPNAGEQQQQTPPTSTITVPPQPASGAPPTSGP